MNIDVPVPELATVIALDPDRPPLRSKRSHDCRHLHALVDPGARKVTCDDCGVELDPIAVLDKLAHDGTRLDAARKRMRATEKRLAELLEREKLAKARVRRWEGRLGDAHQRA